MVQTPLTELSKGKKGTVVRIGAGRALRQRLMSIGFGTGNEIKVIKKGMPGPFIVSIKGCSRIAIGCGEASKIFVETGD